MKKIDNWTLLLGIALLIASFLTEIGWLIWIALALMFLSAFLTLFVNFTMGTKVEKYLSVVSLIIIVLILLYKYGKSLF